MPSAVHRRTCSCRLHHLRHRSQAISGCGRGRASTAACCAAQASGTDPVVAVDGDTVTLHYVCKDESGDVVDSSRERDEPMSLEVGVGEVIGNPLAQALEQAVRSRGVGDHVELELTGGEYKRDLVFTVPLDHPEVQRLQGRYSSQGGLQVDKIVELANGGLAKVLRVTEEQVVLDANNMLAGTQRFIDVEVLRIDRAPA